MKVSELSDDELSRLLAEAHEPKPRWALTGGDSRSYLASIGGWWLMPEVCIHPETEG